MNLLRRFRWAFTGLLCLAAGVWLFEWTFNRTYVPEGHSLRLRYKGPPLPFLPGNRPVAAPGEFARVDENGKPLEVGILKDMLGPGRHFLFVGWWETELVKDVVVKPGEVLLVTSKMGKDLPSGDFLVDGDVGETQAKGILRRVFAPGRYRINPYGYDHKVIQRELIPQGSQMKHAGWVTVPTGFVGVVTNLAGNPATGAQPGIQANVLPSGLYPVNPKEQHIDVIEVGYREKSIKSDLKTGRDGKLIFDESGEPSIDKDDSGIAFPSNDGFRIHMDFTSVWGIMPDQAAEVVRKFGNVAAVENKVVIPQIESIGRNMGSKLGAVDLLVGDTRLHFQEETSQRFASVLKEKDLTLLYGLVRHIYIPQEVRLPIQEKFVADELKSTRDQELLTARTEASLREAEQKVILEGARVKAETEKVVAEAIADGKKTAEETRAETTKLVAAIDKETAILESQAKVVKGEAESMAKQVAAEAKSEKFGLAVAAFGTGGAYNAWVFANGLPEDIQLEFLYAGQGTFWTDLKGFTETMIGRQYASPAAGSTGGK